ncbi:hypothetical protein RGF97_21365 [Streptomyces roseicoloratus]|uniref:Uncharacterized protein n=1 Tax=Streptomyces roseicoloratus TaxID=2508722 RepID=A0ABY9S3Z2_9ACTN|nr:hypothetical protein [Streptomyces roseicoloratus]WMX49149.1 hypothetical protein RGF97_21365 [Streptomyces roseicoloratus]
MVPEEAARMLRLPSRPYEGIHLGQWALLALGVLLTLFFVGVSAAAGSVTPWSSRSSATTAAPSAVPACSG